MPAVRTSVDTPPQAHRHAASKSQGTLTRVFIGDMQRFNMVDIGPATSAKHVLTMVEEQGSLKGWVGTGGWMVWEIAQDFGMERPIRSFELLADVQASWNKDKMVNTFVIKLTPLAPILSRSNIPTSSPTYSGYVEWEAKRGKWSKRYLRLREHSLWLSKRESVKDEVFLCSLSNFDAYNVTRLHKAPKPFCFAVKSTDNLSFFENTADYLHMFACNQRDGEKMGGKDPPRSLVCPASGTQRSLQPEGRRRQRRGRVQCRSWALARGHSQGAVCLHPPARARATPRHRLSPPSWSRPTATTSSSPARSFGNN
ncbi:hypothetical protein C8F04DRAFT_1138144, partial [Mycena alexandri]